MFTQGSSVLKLSKLSLILAAIGWLSIGVVTTARALDPVPIPELAQWESRMTTLGNQYCAPFMNNLGTLDMTRFDAERVYYQIAQYTGDPTSWRACAKGAEDIYQNYVLALEGAVDVDPGQLMYSQGLKKGYLDRSDSLTQLAVMFLALNNPYNFQQVEVTAPYSKSVGVAQALMTYVDHMELGGPKPDRFDLFVTQALGHIDQWYVTRDANNLLVWQTPTATFGHYPYHVGLTMQALIQIHNYQKTHQLPLDVRIPEKIKVALDGLWTHAWVDADNAFYHYNFTKDFGDPKHNLLIAPAYAWYYLLTGDVTYRQHADEIFAGGVGATISSSEDFNKNYAWSFDYVMWRQNGDVVWATGSGDGGSSGGDEGGGSSGGNEGGGGSSGGNEGGSGGGSTTPPVCVAENVKARPSILWPPNHKMRHVQIEVKDQDGHMRPVEITSHSQNEPEQGLGRGDRMPDRVIQNQKLYLRAERGKHGKGRDYTVNFKAYNGQGGVMCQGDVTVKVPRDKGDKRGHHQDQEDERDGGHHDKKSKHGHHHDDGKAKSAKTGGARR